MSDEKGGTALSKARAEAAQAKEDLKKARSSASAARQRDREESSTALKKARSATQAARADARQARAGRLIGHVLFQACAVGSTMAGEAIGDSKLAEKLDTKVEAAGPSMCSARSRARSAPTWASARAWPTASPWASWPRRPSPWASWPTRR
ncbi:MAG: hypothetical protein R3F43_31590 [bacterium]